MRVPLFFLICCAGLAGCGSPKPANLKGSLALDGQPFALPANAGEVFISFHGIGSDGKIDIFKKYGGTVSPSGSFEIIASAGELPVGTYQWSIDSAPGRVKEFEPFSYDKSKARVELKSGPNQIILDLNQR